jgi:transcriptional regulator with XRE-family HTH domain
VTAVREEVGARLGEAIRGQRHVLGLTLVEVAARAGLSHPFLSQLERGLARPSMRSLTAIASALETSAQALLAVAEDPVDPALEPVSLVRRGAGGVESPGGTARALVRGERAMLPLEFSGAPPEFHEYFCHPGDEFVYVVHGDVEFDVEGELYLVSAGESLYYAGGLRHRWRAAGPDEVRLVAVQQNR